MPADPHSKLVKKIKGILDCAGFLTDSEVRVKFNDGNMTPPLDLVAVYENLLIIVECKTTNENMVGRNFKNYVQTLETYTRTMPQRLSTICSISSSFKKIKKRHLASVELVKAILCVSNVNFPLVGKEYVEKMAKSARVLLWGGDAIEYFKRTSESLLALAKYEIFKELGISKEDLANEPREQQKCTCPVFEVKQGTISFFTFSMPVDKLIEIAYVHRRSRKDTWAYQRLINKDRLESVGDYLNKKDSIIPNNILISFDKEVAQKIEDSYDKENKLIEIPLKFCSAWVIDGQHRLFGFSRKRRNINKKFDLIVTGFTRFMPSQSQAKLFVTINDKQRRMKRTLLCDLATIIEDLSDPLTWPSLVAQELNKNGPWKNKIKFSEIESTKSISVEGFIRYALTEFLLGCKQPYKTCTGPLFKYSPFDAKKPFASAYNQAAFRKQVNLLNKYFSAVKDLVHNNNVKKDKWKNHETFYLTRVQGVNALFLVLNRILEHASYNNRDINGINFKEILRPLPGIKFTKLTIKKLGGGYGSYKMLANKIILKINKLHSPQYLKYY